MRFEPTDIAEVIVVEPDVLGDARGFFLEVYHRDKYRAGGIDVQFVQENHSSSRPGTIRGLHCQLQPPQAKLVRVLAGEIFDVAVDIRRGSPSFGRFVSAVLSSANRRMLFIPAGFAHGFCVTSDVPAEVEYKVTGLYNPSGEITIAWNDPGIAIPWPTGDPILSAKDRSAPLLQDQLARLP